MPVGKEKYIRRQTFMESVNLSGNTVKDPLLRKEEVSLKLTSVGVNVRTFDLSNSEDLADYTRLLEESANKKLELVFLSRHWDVENSCMRVYVEWRRYALIQEEK